jgi:hypothetical protein
METQGPLVYLNDLGNWEGYAAPVLLAIVIWIGDALVVSTRTTSLETSLLHACPVCTDIQVFPDLATEL